MYVKETSSFVPSSVPSYSADYTARAVARLSSIRVFELKSIIKFRYFK